MAKAPRNELEITIVRVDEVARPDGIVAAQPPRGEVLKDPPSEALIVRAR
jgi:hypothetical protein